METSQYAFQMAWESRTLLQGYYPQYLHLLERTTVLKMRKHDWCKNDSYNLRILSLPPETTRWESGLQSTAKTSSPCPGRSVCSFFVFILHTAQENWMNLNEFRKIKTWKYLSVWSQRFRLPTSVNRRTRRFDKRLGRVPEELWWMIRSSHPKF